MLFNKLALTFLGIAAAAAALPTTPSANVGVDTDGVLKRGPEDFTDVDATGLEHRGACWVSPDGRSHYGC